jgi:ABC-type dipeptide/oligopeptide/nickel transport system permease component
MALFLIKRLAGGILTLYVIATLCFVIIYFTPGSPLTGERNMPPEVLRNQERALGPRQAAPRPIPPANEGLSQRGLRNVLPLQQAGG